MPEVADIKKLLHQLSNSEAHAFRQVFNLFSDRVYSFALKLTRSKNTAEEIVQEVFLRIWLHRESMAQIENLQSYLFTITRNFVFNYLKHKAIEEKAKSILLQQSTQIHEETEDGIVYRDYQRLLTRAINHLPPQQKLVYSLCHQEGLQYEEVAQKLKISRLTVKTHMQLALRSIKSQVAELVRITVLFIPLFI